jgi:transketolase
MLNADLKLNPKLFDPDVEQIPTRNGFGEGLVILGKENPRVVVLTGDLEESTRVMDFHEEIHKLGELGKLANFHHNHPERFVEVGVAEQNLMGIAAGLALSGKIPFVSSYATFCPGRAWDQVRVSVCYTKANVKIAGAHSGISVGPDGATHQALEDIASMRVLPNLIVLAPCDTFEAKKITLAVAKYVGPVYFRFAREKTPIITTEETPFEIGKAQILWNHDEAQVAIVGCGPLVYEALVAAKQLEAEGIGSIVINSPTIKPLDVDTISSAAHKAGAVITIEEHQITGGLGGAVAEALGEHYPVPIERVGMRDTFGESGAPNELLEKYGLKAKDIVVAVKKVILRKKY